MGNRPFNVRSILAGEAPKDVAIKVTIRSRPRGVKPGILMHIHPVLPLESEASATQLPRPGPEDDLTKAHT